jgi:hypothetical protein
MKYILFYEILNLQEAEKRLKHLQEVAEKLQKEVAPTLKSLTPPFLYPDLSGGIQLVEVEAIEEIVAIVSFYEGVAEVSVSPLVEVAQALEVQDKVSKL